MVFVNGSGDLASDPIFVHVHLKRIHICIYTHKIMHIGSSLPYGTDLVRIGGDEPRRKTQKTAFFLLRLDKS